MKFGKLALAYSAAAHRRALCKRIFGTLLLGAALTVSAMFAGAGTASAVEVGEPAPDFTMPSTMGGNISLSDYRGKKWVLLEFYGADFAPT